MKKQYGKSIAIYLSPHYVRMLDYIAQDNDTNRSQVIRTAVREYAKNYGYGDLRKIETKQ